MSRWVKIVRNFVVDEQNLRKNSYACTRPGSGGVVPENVQIVPRLLRGNDSTITNTSSAYNSQYYLRLEVHGNYYTGNLYGTFPNQTRRTDPQGKLRVGALLSTTNYYASGRYEVSDNLSQGIFYKIS